MFDDPGKSLRTAVRSSIGVTNRAIADVQTEMARKMGYMNYWDKPQSEVAALLSEPNFSRPYIVVANLWETAVWGSVVHKPPRAEVDMYTVYVSQFGSGVSQVWIGSGHMYSIVTAGQQWDEFGWFAPPTQADMLNKPQELPDGISLNDVRAPGEYSKGAGGGSVTDMPYSVGGFSLKVELNRAYDNGVKQTWSSYNANDTWTRVLDNGTWSPWLRLTNTNDLLNKANAIGAYYASVTADGAPDISTDSALIVELGQSKNAELWGALGHSFWAFIWQQFYVERSTSTLRTQLAVGGNGYMAARTYDNMAQAWTPWVSQATATPPEEHNLPLEAGCTAFMRSKYFKSQENIVTFYATAQRESGFSDALRIATLPAGFRPLERTDFPATFSHFEDANARIPGFVMLSPDGGLRVAANLAGHSIAYVLGSFVTSA